jgi:Mlc titration factor MtfA (ptsG expression regulator)
MGDFYSILTMLAVFSGVLAIGFIFTTSTPVRQKWNILKPLSPRHRNTLITKFPYYKNLSNAQRKEFEKRLKHFLARKEFIAREMPLVTDEMQVLIGACAVQITFGYKPISFSHFNKIILYPTKYQSDASGRMHRGEVNPNGVIILSWEDFLRGYKIPNDGLNLGLHEMAHALRLEDAVPSEDYAFMNNDSLRKWHKVCMREMKKVRYGHRSFLRKYAGTDPEEFFAVCIEKFFEQPYEFKRELPEVFNALVQLLNQDPTKFYRPAMEG